MRYGPSCMMKVARYMCNVDLEIFVKNFRTINFCVKKFRMNDPLPHTHTHTHAGWQCYAMGFE